MKTEAYRDISGESDVIEFIESGGDISIFQSKYFLDLYNRTDGLEGVMFVARRSGKVTGVLLVQLQNYFGKVFNYISKRAIITGGPYTSAGDYESAETLLREYRKYIGKSVVYTQVRRLSSGNEDTPVFIKNGYTYTDHLNYLVNLSEGEESCWKNLHQKRRNEVRKAVKEGIEFSEINYGTEMNKAYDVLKEIYGRAGLPLPDGGYFHDARELMGGEGIFRIFGGYYGGKLIGVMYVLCYKGVIYDWYAGSYHEYLKKCPNDLITWEVIRFGIKNGFSLFDFGGAGNPAKEYGVRDFKKKFGGREFNTGRFELIHKPVIMKLAGAGFRVWQNIKKTK